MIPSGVKVMVLRRDDLCSCGTTIACGTTAGWSRIERRVICAGCLEAGSPSENLVVEVGTPGASLDREYERRAGARRARVLTRHPRVGRLLLHLVGEPRTTTAFATGADGERIVAQKLVEHLGESALFLYNRTLGEGGARGDIDLIAIVPSGVWIVDAKKYAGRRIRADRRRTTFVIDGRRHAKLADSMDRQLTAVRAMTEAGPTQAPVQGAYCFVDADLPWTRLTVRHVPAFSLRRLRKELQKPGNLGVDERIAIHRHLAHRLPPA